MTTTTKTKNTAPAFTDGKLPILISARVRLTDEQRKTLKEAYYKALANHQPEAKPLIPGSTVSSSTSYNLDKSLGFDSYLFADVINSRDTVSLLSLLSMSKTLNVEVITKQDIIAAAEGYVDYIFSKV